MKKILVIMIALCVCVMMFTSCSSKNHSYKELENKYIDIAVKKVSEECNMEINKDDYDYTVMEQISETEFEKLDETREPEIVTVSAIANKDVGKEAFVSFAVSYNTFNNEVDVLSFE